MSGIARAATLRGRAAQTKSIDGRAGSSSRFGLATVRKDRRGV